MILATLLAQVCLSYHHQGWTTKGGYIGAANKIRERGVIFCACSYGKLSVLVCFGNYYRTEYNCLRLPVYERKKCVYHNGRSYLFYPVKRMDD